MATSGNFLTSDSGQGGGNYYGRMIFEWWQVNSGISGSVGYHGINYHLKTWGGNASYYQYFFNGSMNVDGAGYSWGTTKAYGNGATVFGDYGKTLYTDSVGNRSFSASAQGGIYVNTINTSGSGSWSLDNIPLHSVLTGISTDTGGIPFTDEGPAWVEFNNPAGTATQGFIDVIGYGRVVTSGNVGSRYNFDYSGGTLAAAIQTASPNSNTYSINIGIVDELGGGFTYDYRVRSGTIANDSGQANPTFSTFTFADANSTTSTITGNNQYMIQGYSDLVATITTGNKATANKHATMDHYTYIIGGYSNNAAWSSGSTVTKDIGTISDVTGARTLTVIAVDSRGNSKTVNQTVNIIPYAAPTVNATAVRANGYDDALILTVAGSVSPLTISGTDKNSIHSVATSTANKVEYRVGVDGGAYGSWVDLSATQTATTGVVTGSSAPIIAAAGATSATHSYQIQVQITDKLNTTTQTLSIPTGTPIMRIGTDGNVYFNEVAYYSTNSITSSATPAPVGSAALNTFYVTALAAAAAFSAPSGTLTNGNRLLIRIKDNGTARALTWNAVYRAVGVTLPTTTVISKTLYVGCVYNFADTKWDVIAVSQEV